MSVWSLHGAAARNELKNMTANQFFQYGTVGKEYAKYFDAENARRGNPIVKGNAGVEVGQMVQFNWTDKKLSGSGRVKAFDGDRVEVGLQGGKYSWYVPKSSITHYAKDKGTDFAQLTMKSKITRKSARKMTFGRG